MMRDSRERSRRGDFGEDDAQGSEASAATPQDSVQGASMDRETRRRERRRTPPREDARRDERERLTSDAIVRFHR